MKLYLKFLSMHIKSQMQYKISFVLIFVSQLVATIFAFLGIRFLFAKFGHVEGFRYEEVLLCFAIVNFSFSLSKCISEGFDSFSSIISDTEFDRMLVRPRSTLLQVLISKLEFYQLGAVFQSFILLIYAVSNSNFAWTYPKIGVLMLMLLAGICVFLSLSVLYAFFCFFTIDGLHIVSLLATGGQEFGKYPLVIYGQGILAFFTYVIPIALFQYYPLLYLTNRSTHIIHALSPLCCTLFIIPCVLLWNCGVKNYKSVGS